MGFGLSFGANKTKTSQTENKTENQTTSQTQNTNQQQNTTGTSATTQTGSTSNVGSTTSDQAQKTTGTQATTGTQTGGTTSFSRDVLAALTSLALKGVAGSGSSDAATALSGSLAQLGKFDSDAYVKGVTDAATAKAQTDLDAGVGTMEAQVGGTESTNSMAALLGNRLRSDSAASVAGISAQAEQTAAGIVQGNAAAANTAVGTEDSFLTNVLAALKGGTTSSTTATAEGTTTAGTSATTGGTTSTESGTSASNTNTATTQSVATIIEQLLNGTTQTVTNDQIKGKTSKIGGGASLT